MTEKLTSYQTAWEDPPEWWPPEARMKYSSIRFALRGVADELMKNDKKWHKQWESLIASNMRLRERLAKYEEAYPGFDEESSGSDECSS